MRLFVHGLVRHAYTFLRLVSSAGMQSNPAPDVYRKKFRMVCGGRGFDSILSQKRNFNVASIWVLAG